MKVNLPADGLVKRASTFLSRHIVWLQGTYYLIGGLWPLLSFNAFEALTGPKTDIWLVKTVGLLLLIIGASLVLAAYRRQVDLPVIALGVGTALVLVAVELVYVFSGTISMVYLFDTLLQVMVLIGWFRRKTLSISHPLNRRSGTVQDKP